jgi:hypothetical protein
MKAFSSAKLKAVAYYESILTLLLKRTKQSLKLTALQTSDIQPLSQFFFLISEIQNEFGGRKMP